MHDIETTMQPGVRRTVEDAEYKDLKSMGLIARDYSESESGTVEVDLPAEPGESVSDPGFPAAFRNPPTGPAVA